MTEDDTFMKLKQISPERLEEIINTMSKEKFNELCRNPKAKECFLNHYGWSLEEFHEYAQKIYS